MWLLVQIGQGPTLRTYNIHWTHKQKANGTIAFAQESGGVISFEDPVANAFRACKLSAINPF
jgi:hypothetical protein